MSLNKAVIVVGFIDYVSLIEPFHLKLSNWFAFSIYPFLPPNNSSYTIILVSFGGSASSAFPS